MGRAFIVGGSGGGDTSDDCTATKQQVLEGYKAITSDSDSDADNGTMKNLTNRTTIKHTTSNSTPVIAGNYAYMTTNTDGKSRTQVSYDGEDGFIKKNTLFGVETSKMATAGGLTAAKLLANQSAFGITGTATNDTTATDPYVYNGRTYYSKGVKRTGTMTIASVVSFSVAAYSTSQILCTWKNPAKGPYSGVIIRYKTGSYPTSVSDGTLGYQGTGTNLALNATSTATINNLAASTTYYFRIWMYCNTSVGALYSGNLSATGTVASHGSKTFTSSGTFTIPNGVRSVRAFLVGGGGGGSNGYTYKGDGAGGGGGGGYTTTTPWITVSPGSTYAIVVGSGGRSANLATPYDGGASTAFGYSAAGGKSSIHNGTRSYGGSGGSGGGQAGGESSNKIGGRGGENGSNGYMSASTIGGGSLAVYGSIGQGITTRAWGSSSSTLYSGGGGGGSNYVNTPSAGGAGGGGRGGVTRVGGEPGGTNTGGGGGGGNRYTSDGSSGGADGGTGIVLIEW